MSHTRALACLVGAISLAVGLVAHQQKPNFSGRWVVVSPAKGAGQEEIIKHDDKTLSRGHASEGAGHSMTHQLDGSEKRNVIPSHGKEIVILSKAAWDGNRVVITSSASYPTGMKTESKEIWSLDDQGRLVIDFSESTEGQLPMSMKVIHTRKN